MVVKGVALQCQQDEVTPAGIIVGESVMDNEDQGLDVMDTDDLGVEAGNGGALNMSTSRRRGASGGATRCRMTAASSRSKATTSGCSCCHTRAVLCACHEQWRQRP
jgi:hypothetical protein